MTAADSNSTLSNTLNENRRPTACFSVNADIDPGMLPRVLEPFAKRGLTPRQVHVTEDDANGRQLQIDLQMADMNLGTASKIGSTLDQMFGVNSVLVSTKVAG